MEKILTIVIPTYNMEKYLDRCLSSLVVEPDWMDRLEVLVVNDGSKDRSSAIAHGYESKYPRTFKVIDKENGNYGSCVNAGIQQALGKYFRILDADDWFDTEDFFSFLKKLSTSDADLIFTDYTECIVGGETVRRCMPEAMLENVTYDTSAFMSFALNYYFQMHRMTYKRQVLVDSETVLQEGISYTDTEYCFYPIRKVLTMERVNLSPYQYMVGRIGQSMSDEALKKSLWQLRKVLEALIISYERHAEDMPEAVKVTSRKYVEGKFILYYSFLLTEFKRDIPLDEEMKEMDSFLGNHAYFYALTDNFTHNRIHYVRVWRKWSLYNTFFLFQFNNWCWKIIKVVVDWRKSQRR